MRSAWICSAAAVAILWVGSTGWAKSTTDQKDTKSTAQKKLDTAKKELEKAKKDFDTEMAPWKEVRKLAEGEKATKTLAAIDKIMKAKEDEFKKVETRLEKQIAADEKALTGTQTTTEAKPKTTK